MFKLFVRVLFAIEGLLLLGSLGQAQSFVLDLPRPSQHAVITQRIGITDITINYHRPVVNKRKVWGGLVPYGQVWRAGANENTTIKFTDPVTIEGKPLPKGTYGLHMIPGENEWTVIFSKNSTSWGSFTYDQAEDALRVTVKPQAADFHEALDLRLRRRKSGFVGGHVALGEGCGSLQGRREHTRNRGRRTCTTSFAVWPSTRGKDGTTRPTTCFRKRSISKRR